MNPGHAAKAAWSGAKKIASLVSPLVVFGSLFRGGCLFGWFMGYVLCGVTGLSASIMLVVIFAAGLGIAGWATYFYVRYIWLKKLRADKTQA